MQARVALTLRMVAGLTAPEIARAFLVQETAMRQRITRAKAKIKAARIPYRVPSADDLPARVVGVLAVLFLIFNEGYLATGPGTDPVRHDLTAEAIRLTRLIRALMPEDGEVAGLLALMLLTEARSAARVPASGELVTLDQQDRGTWDAALIAEGHQLVRERLASGVAPGRYQILAAINAVHTSARDIRDTDWSQIVALYKGLTGGPGAFLNSPSNVIEEYFTLRSPCVTDPYVTLSGCSYTAFGLAEPPRAACLMLSAAAALERRRLAFAQAGAAAGDDSADPACGEADGWADRPVAGRV